MTIDDRDLIEQFEDRTLPPTRLDHQTHVKLGWLYLRRDPLLIALDRFRRTLQAYVAAHGQADRYHETITWAYLVLIHERMQRHDSPQAWAEFAASNPDLLGNGKRVLASYYRPETLASSLARRVFVFPDALGGSGQS
ncbi:MAG TPA: hypothetical protein VNM90_24160 [Haliangium sp.]|nr:hypothetical protein [Haliangium sp.]